MEHLELSVCRVIQVLVAFQVFQVILDNRVSLWLDLKDPTVCLEETVTTDSLDQEEIRAIGV